MGRVSQSIPNLFNGVSQQAPNIRLTSQGQEQINGYSSIADGLKKRPPTEHIAKLQVVPTSDNVFIHFINRDATERYIVLIVDGTLKVWDLAGNAKTVNVIDSASNYLAGVTDARNDYAMVTVADTTFIINKKKKVLSTGSAASLSNEAWVWVKRGVVSTTYSVTLDGTNTYSYSTGASGNVGSDVVAQNLTTAINGGPYTATQYGSSIHITYANPFTMRVSDGYGEQGMIGFMRETARITDLPPQCVHGYKVEITNDPDTSDSYYMEFVAEAGSGVGTGHWEECRYWGEGDHSLDATTMPIILQRQTDGTFNLQKCTWASREAGDSDTAPLPSFVDNYISDVFFYRNRLGFTADENTIMSEAGEYFNFFRKTATELLDSDPIDVAIAHTKVSDVRYVLPWNESLMLFSDQNQFVLSHEEVMSPESVSIDVASEFPIQATVRPVGAGANLYFASPRGDFTAIREYFVNQNNETKDASDVTAHCPKYIPKNAYILTASTAEDALFVASLDDTDTLYIYKWYWRGEEKLQSSWSKWTFGTDATLYGLGIIDTTLYLCLKRTDGIYLEKIMLQSGVLDGNLNFSIHLDRKCEVTGVYDGGNDWTTWTLPYEDASTDFLVIRGPDFGQQEGNSVTNTTRPSNTTIRVSGDFSAGECWVGRKYTHEYTFSTIFVRDGDGQAIVSGRLQLLKLYVSFANSGYFYMTVTPGAQNAYEYDYGHNLKVGTPEAVIGQAYIATGKFDVPIMAKSDNVIIKIINDSYFPSAVQSAEWEGNHVMLTRRV